MAVVSRAVEMVLVTCLLVNVNSNGQQLPSRDESAFLLQSRHPEIFYDTKVIPDGAEVTAFLLKNVTTRFFFTIDETGVPFVIMVIPCSSAIDVRIVYQDIPADESNDDEDYNYYGDEHGQNNSNEDFIGSMFYKTSSDGRQFEVTRFPESVLLAATTRSNDAVIFELQSAASGLYSIIVTGIDRDSSVKLYATTSPHIDSVIAMTSLPVDKTVSIVRTLSNEISFAWRPTDLPSLYCLAINTLRHFRTQCAAIGFLDGDPEPTVPSNAGFGFSWEREAARRRRARARQRAASAARGSDKRRQVLSYTCVGPATNYTFRNLTPGSRYFIDIYAVSVSTNVSRYHGRVNISTPMTSSTSKAGRLTEGRETRVLLTAKHPVKLLEYAQRNNHRRNASYNISLYFRSCSMDPTAYPVRVTVERRQSSRSQPWVQLLSTIITGSFQTLSLSGSKPGPLRVRMELDAAADSSKQERRRDSAAGLKVQSLWTLMVVAENTVGDPYPVLPRSLTLRVLADNSTRDVLSGCHRSVTLAWFLAGVRPTQRYCLFATELTSTTPHMEQPDKCSDHRRRTSVLVRKSRKIACKDVPGTKTSETRANQRPASGTDDVTVVSNEQIASQESLMIQTVSGLKVGRRYAFDVQVTRVLDKSDTSTGAGSHFRVYDRLVTSPTTIGCFCKRLIERA